MPFRKPGNLNPSPTVLLTGGSGYLGQILAKSLSGDLSAGRLSTLISSDIREVSPGQSLPGVQYEQVDIRDKGRLEALFSKYRLTTVVHLAAVIDAHSMSREVQYQIDVEGTRNVVEACLSAGIQRLIVSSSGAAYGYHPDNPEWLTEDHPVRGNAVFAYSDHKRQVEEMLAGYRSTHPQLEQTILRLSTVLGASTDNIITQLFQRKALLGVRGFPSPFVFIWDEDAAECFRQAVFSEKTGIFNVAGDGALTPMQLADIMKKPYRAIPSGIFRALLRGLRMLGLSSYGPEQMIFLQFRPVLDNRRLKEVFDFKHRKTSLEAFEWYWEANK